MLCPCAVQVQRAQRHAAHAWRAGPLRRGCLRWGDATGHGLGTLEQLTRQGQGHSQPSSWEPCCWALLTGNLHGCSTATELAPLPPAPRCLTAPTAARRRAWPRAPGRPHRGVPGLLPTHARGDGWVQLWECGGGEAACGAAQLCCGTCLPSICRPNCAKAAWWSPALPAPLHNPAGEEEFEKQRQALLALKMMKVWEGAA